MPADLAAGDIDLLRFIASRPDGRATTDAILAHVGDDDAASYRVDNLLNADFLVITKYNDPPKPSREDGFVVVFATGAPCEFQITIAGRDYLALLDQMLQEQRERDAKEEAQRHEDDARAREQNRKNRHHDYFVAAFEASIAFIFGVIFEHYVQIVAFIQKLFH